jgi:hypothetical protein
MGVKIINVALAVAMLVGGVFTLMLIPQTQRLQKQARRLELIYGSANASRLWMIVSLERLT